MVQDLVRQLAALQRQVDGLVRPEVGRGLFTAFLDLPGLVGFWPMSSVQRSTGQAYDLSGQARHLTYNGNPTYNIYNDIVPYIDLDGTGDFLSRADETDLDILGTETIYASAVRGLTLGGWFWTDTAGVQQTFLAKFNAATTGSYTLRMTAGNVALFLIVNSTPAQDFVTHTSAFTSGAWHFIAGRFMPSSEMALFHNGIKVSQASSSTAIQNSSDAFQVGARTGTVDPLDGRASLCFLCANALPDALISALFQQSRSLFNV